MVVDRPCRLVGVFTSGTHQFVSAGSLVCSGGLVVHDMLLGV